MTLRTTLGEATRILKLHPRTILRAISKESNPYWADGYDCPVDTQDLSKAFKVKPMLMDAVFLDKKPLLRPNEAAELLKMNPRTFRTHHYPAIIKKGNSIVRFSEDHLKSAYTQRLELKSIL